MVNGLIVSQIKLIATGKLLPWMPPRCTDHCLHFSVRLDDLCAIWMEAQAELRLKTSTWMTEEAKSLCKCRRKSSFYRGDFFNRDALLASSTMALLPIFWLQQRSRAGQHVSKLFRDSSAMKCQPNVFSLHKAMGHS